MMGAVKIYVFKHGYRSGNIDLVVREAGKGSVLILRIQELGIDIEFSPKEAEDFLVSLNEIIRVLDSNV